MRNRPSILVALVLALAGAGPAGATLDEFARCLSKAGARFYGTSWCPHCAAQRRLFGPAFDQVAYVECSVNNTKETTAECTQAEIATYPTWEFADGSRVTGQQSLVALAAKTGCRYDPGREPQILDVPAAGGGVVKLPGAESVEIIELP